MILNTGIMNGLHLMNNETPAPKGECPLPLKGIKPVKSLNSFLYLPLRQAQNDIFFRRKSSFRGPPSILFLRDKALTDSRLKINLCNRRNHFIICDPIRSYLIQFLCLYHLSIYIHHLNDIHTRRQIINFEFHFFPG